MSTTCSHCGAVNDDNTQFCSQCGAQLQQPAPQPQQTPPPQPQPNPYYQAPPVQQTTIYQQGEKPVSILGWIGYFLLFSIPVVNIIALIAILCSSQNKTLKNWILAQIILVVVVVIICVLVFLIAGVSLSDAFSNY
ncbi:MAG: zinc ribbon domain-containing protein [Ruminococcus sp.]